MAGRPYQIKEFKYNSHYWLLRLLARRKQPLRILDIETADGYLGARLAGLGHRLVGVEADRAAARRARSCYEVLHHCDVEAFEFPYRDEFDAILLADVLEHLRRPEDVLRRCLPCLNSAGQVIVSVPNIANLWIRWNLLLDDSNTASGEFSTKRICASLPWRRCGGWSRSAVSRFGRP